MDGSDHIEVDKSGKFRGYHYPTCQIQTGRDHQSEVPSSNTDETSSSRRYGHRQQMIQQWWTRTVEKTLAQGDILPDCLLPVFANPTPTADDTPREVQVKMGRLIVVTQTCDLQNNKVEFVALCPIHNLDEYAETNHSFRTMKNWEEVRKGRRPALHLLASPETPADCNAAFVVDFGHILSLPTEYLIRHLESLEGHWRLLPPFLEHFSQAFARFFMRVGLPSSIPPFK